MPKDLINGIGLYYEDHGSGLPVIFTHGFAGTTRSWDGQVPALSKNYRFITYDMRGHGQSDAPENLSQYTLDILLDDLYWLLRHLGVDQAVIGGLSLGGYLSIHFCLRHPDMTAAVIPMDCGPGYRTPEKAKQWNDRTLARAALLETQGMKGFQASPFSKDDYYTTPEVMLKHDPRGLANISRGAMMNPWGVNLMPYIKAPTLVICGDRDAAFLPGTDYMTQKIPGAKKVIIADAGHGVNIDQPEVFESTVLAFLGALKLRG